MQNAKKISISFAVFVGLFLIASITSGQLINPLPGVNDFKDLILKITTTVSDLITGIGVIMIIVSGIMFLLSAGSPEKIKNAKTALTYAIVGIAIGVTARGIVQTIQWIIGGGR